MMLYFKTCWHCVSKTTTLSIIHSTFSLQSSNKHTHSTHAILHSLSTTTSRQCRFVVHHHNHTILAHTHHPSSLSSSYVLLAFFFLFIVSYALSCIRTCYASFSALSMYMSFEPSCFISFPLIPRLLFVSFPSSIFFNCHLMYIFLSCLSITGLSFTIVHINHHQSNISYLILQASNLLHHILESLLEC